MARVLVVEDKLENLELMVYLLKAFGHETLTARNGKEGVDVVTATLPDVVIMDLQMPVMDGYEAARALKAEQSTKQIPLVAVTAYAMVGDRERVLGSGFDGYITKPIDPATFVRDVEGFLQSQVADGENA